MNNKEYMIKQLIGNRTNLISNYISVRSETVTINEYELDFRDQGTRSCSTNGAKALTDKYGYDKDGKSTYHKKAANVLFQCIYCELNSRLILSAIVAVAPLGRS